MRTLHRDRCKGAAAGGQFSVLRLVAWPCFHSLAVSHRLTGCAIGEGQVEELCSILEQHGWLAEVE